MAPTLIRRLETLLTIMKNAHLDNDGGMTVWQMDINAVESAIMELKYPKDLRCEACKSDD